MRSTAQCETKWRNYERHGYSGYDVLTDFDAREYYQSLVADDAALAQGLASGAFVVDNRLRDALRTIRAESGGLTVPDGSRPLYLPALTTSEAAALAADAAAGSERDALIEIVQRVGELESRLAAIERPLGPASR
jgi:hypothetical protein